MSLLVPNSIPVHHEVVLSGQRIQYKVRVSLRARHLRLSFAQNGLLVATLPVRVSHQMAERFIFEKAAWILHNRKRLAEQKKNCLPHGPLHFLRNKGAARRLVMGLIEELNVVYQVLVKSVTVRDQKTRWGSCSRDGRLSFSYKILFLPAPLQRYVVAHELSHRKEFNHGQQFWMWVKKTIPTYPVERRELKKWSLR